MTKGRERRKTKRRSGKTTFWESLHAQLFTVRHHQVSWHLVGPWPDEDTSQASVTLSGSLFGSTHKKFIEDNPLITRGACNTSTPNAWQCTDKDTHNNVHWCPLEHLLLYLTRKASTKRVTEFLHLIDCFLGDVLTTTNLLHFTANHEWFINNEPAPWELSLFRQHSNRGASCMFN